MECLLSSRLNFFVNMDTTKQIYKRINQFIQTGQFLLTKEVNGNKLGNDHKLAYALRRVLPKCEEAMIDYQEQVEDLENEFASVDKEGNVLRDQFGYKFSKDNLKKKNEKIRELFKTKEVDVPQYIATELPEWLPEDVKDVLNGFVLKIEQDA